MKFVDYYESNKQMGRVCVSRVSMKQCKIQGRMPAPQEALIKAGCAKNKGDEA